LYKYSKRPNRANDLDSRWFFHGTKMECLASILHDAELLQPYLTRDAVYALHPAYATPFVFQGLVFQILVRTYLPYRALGDAFVDPVHDVALSRLNPMGKFSELRSLYNAPIDEVYVLVYMNRLG
jgi:hypothetical protein